MTSYSCTNCSYITTRKSSFQKHINSKKHQELVRIQPDFICDIKQLYSEQHICHYCKKRYRYRQGLNKHIKYSCKFNKDESFQELASLLNQKDQQIQENTVKIEKLEKQIEKLMNKLQINTINYGNMFNGNQTNNTNIQLLNYNNTDYGFLTPKDFIHCLQETNHCVKALIEKVHFNKNKPENMNIYISSLKGKFVMVYRDNKWQVKTRKEQIDNLYECNELLLENWFDEYHEKYPHIIKSFKRYLENKDNDDDLISKVKDEILLMLYNKRDIVLKNKEELECNGFLAL